MGKASRGKNSRRQETLQERIARINAIVLRRTRELREWAERETGREIAKELGGDPRRWGALASKVWARAGQLYDDMGASCPGKTPDALVRALAEELGINPDEAMAAYAKIGDVSS